LKPIATIKIPLICSFADYVFYYFYLPGESPLRCGMVRLKGICPRNIFAASPVSQRYKSEGPSTDKKETLSPMGGLSVTIKIAVPSFTSSNMATYIICAPAFSSYLNIQPQQKLLDRRKRAISSDEQIIWNFLSKHKKDAAFFVLLLSHKKQVINIVR